MGKLHGNAWAGRLGTAGAVLLGAAFFFGCGDGVNASDTTFKSGYAADLKANALDAKQADTLCAAMIKYEQDYLDPNHYGCLFDSFALAEPGPYQVAQCEEQLDACERQVLAGTRGYTFTSFAPRTCTLGPSCAASMQTLEACVTARLNFDNTKKCTDLVSPMGLPACDELQRQCPFIQF